MAPLKTVSLGQLVEPIETWIPARERPDKAFRYVDLSAIDQKTKTIVDVRELTCAQAPSRARQLVSKGDVLVSTVRPNLNGVAYVPETLDGATVSTGFCVLRARAAELHDRYLFHWVKTPQFVAAMVKKATGASYPAVSDSTVLESNLPLPSLPEQRRIAEVLDRAEDLRSKRRLALTEFDTLSHSIFLDTFGDPVTNPNKMKIVRLEEVTTRITDGVHQRPNYTDSGVPFISVKDITTGVLKFDDCKFISKEDHDTFTKRCKPERNDLLYTKVGATYGRPALVDTDREFSIYVSVCLIKPNKELIDAIFLRAVLGTTAIKAQADKRIKGIGVPDLHLDQIQSFLIPLPPLGEQRDFAQRIAALNKLRASHQASLSDFDALFVSLQQSAFCGAL